jgi:thiol:disulfide interchange protein
MEGDWTQRDEMITNFLKKYNVISVPAYFIKLPDGNIKFLGETISISKIQDFL